jgi:hypothetical protein
MLPKSIRLGERCAEAVRVEHENPDWIVLFGVYSKQFVCFPRFAVPRGTVVIDRCPEVLPARFRNVEQTYRER